MDGLFPSLPKDITKMSDEELSSLLADHEQAAGLIDANDVEFLGTLSADEIIEQYRTGAEQIKALRAETQGRIDAATAFDAERAAIAAELNPVAEVEPDGDDGDGDGDSDAEPEPEAEAVAEIEVSDPVKDRVLVTASAEVEPEIVEPEKPRLRRAPPAPAADRVVVTSEPDKSLAFVASGLIPSTVPGTKLEDRASIADAVKRMATALGKPSKNMQGREDRYLVASLNYGDQFPEDRKLHASDWQANAEKIRQIGSPFLGKQGVDALVASGGFCAPLEPIYTMPQLATNARPVRDALPNFRADRGGINVPTPTTIGDATGAITVITAAEDELGGTFATKSCLDMACPDYSEYAVTIISHCREFGNLNAMAWPEKIAHENELTMAEHARVADSYLLDQIKALSVNVTSGADTLNAVSYLVDAITKSKFGIRSRLRLPAEARFVALLPRVLGDMLELDVVQSTFDRWRTLGEMVGYLGEVGIDVNWYLDTPSTGVSQIADAAQAAGALDGFPTHIQWALFPAGTFLHLDMAELNLGIVRDSTLNSTNDFQIFGEVFENVARIGPAQAAYWETTDLCPVGTFPPAGTARTCES